MKVYTLGCQIINQSTVFQRKMYLFIFLNRCFHNTSQFYKIRSLNQVGLNKVCCFNERIQIQSADLIHCKQNQ